SRTCMRGRGERVGDTRTGVTAGRENGERERPRSARMRAPCLHFTNSLRNPAGAFDLAASERANRAPRHGTASSAPRAGGSAPSVRDRGRRGGRKGGRLRGRGDGARTVEGRAAPPVPGFPT